MGNVDVGRAEYLGLPYYGRWLLAVGARSWWRSTTSASTELTERMAEVKARYAGGLDGRAMEAKPKFEGDGAEVKRNSHHLHAVGKGDPQVYAGQAGQPRSRSATRCWCAMSCRCCSTPAHRNMSAAPQARSRRWPTKARPRRTRRGTVPTPPPEWFYVVRFNMSQLWHGYTGTATDTCADRRFPNIGCEAAS